MKKINMIAGQMFRLQLSARIIVKLVEQGFMEYDDKQIDEAIRATARLLKDGIELEDFSYDFVVTDKDAKKTYIA